jgi:hypothetical protein
MTRERLLEIFENTESSCKGHNAFKGLLILAKYIDPDAKGIIRAAEHDIIYCGDIDELLEAGLTEEDAIALRSLNWMTDDEEEGFACFV